MLEGMIAAHRLALHGLVQPQEHARRVEELVELFDKGRWTSMLSAADEYLSVLASAGESSETHAHTLYERATEVSSLTRRVRERVASHSDSLVAEVVSPGFDDTTLLGDPHIIISHPRGGLVSQSFVRPDGRVASLATYDLSKGECWKLDQYSTAVFAEAVSREDAYERVLSRVHLWYGEVFRG